MSRGGLCHTKGTQVERTGYDCDMHVSPTPLNPLLGVHCSDLLDRRDRGARHPSFGIGHLETEDLVLAPWLMYNSCTVLRKSTVLYLWREERHGQFRRHFRLSKKLDESTSNDGEIRLARHNGHQSSTWIAHVMLYGVKLL